MPNYNETIIYKICCRDTTIKDIYVGSTCNFTRRKARHKCNCNGQDNSKVYKFIRENGGWDNWDMIMIEEYKCENKRQKDQRERYWIDELKPSLNCISICITEEEKNNRIKKWNKSYYEKHKEKIKEKQKINYYKKNSKIA
jgi:hypothetical protein